MLRKIGVLVVVLVCVITIAGVGLYGYYLLSQKPVSSSVDETVSVKIQVPVGRTIRSVSHELEAEGIIRSELAFYVAARFADVQMKAGTYRLSSDMSVADIFNQLQSGRQDYLAVSIPEGLTVSKVAVLLEGKEVVPADDFLAVAHDSRLLDEYGIPADSFEGYIFPDTYFFNPGMTAEAVLRMMVDTFFDRIASVEVLSHATADELFRVVTLASIVEREYRVASEAPLIASVFTNRLERNIGLYSCATVEYIITEQEGRPHPDRITNKDLELDSPYNTYKWAGLPPGPISNPGLVALNAAANPPETSYYFFRLTDSSAGTHYFSESLEEHVDAGRIYTKRAAGS